MLGDRPNKVTFTLLQIFRGFAAVLVVLVHATGIANDHFSSAFLRNYFAMGNAGVDFFFVLSGFLICYIHGADVGVPARTRTYLLKRFIRIYPIYWIVTLVILPTFAFVPSYGLGDELKPLVIAGSISLFPMGRSPILVAGWTLRYEIFFYLIFAALIAVRSRWALRTVILWALGVVVSAIISFDSPRNFFGLVDQVLFWPQNLEFLLGCLAALVMRHPSAAALSKRGWTAVLMVAAVAFGLTGLLPNEFLDLRTGKHVFLYGGITFVIVVAASMIDQLGGLSAWFVRSAIYQSARYLGDASYSLYLVHGPCLSVTFKIAASIGLIRKLGVAPTTWLVLGFTLLVGCLCHAVVERPLLSWLRRTMPRGETRPRSGLVRTMNGSHGVQ